MEEKIFPEPHAVAALHAKTGSGRMFAVEYVNGMWDSKASACRLTKLLFYTIRFAALFAQ